MTPLFPLKFRRNKLIFSSIIQMLLSSTMSFSQQIQKQLFTCLSNLECFGNWDLCTLQNVSEYVDYSVPKFVSISNCFDQKENTEYDMTIKCMTYINSKTCLIFSTVHKLFILNLINMSIQHVETFSVEKIIVLNESQIISFSKQRGNITLWNILVNEDGVCSFQKLAQINPSFSFPLSITKGINDNDFFIFGFDHNRNEYIIELWKLSQNGQYVNRTNIFTHSLPIQATVDIQMVDKVQNLFVLSSKHSIILFKFNKQNSTFETVSSCNSVNRFGDNYSIVPIYGQHVGRIVLPEHYSVRIWNFLSQKSETYLEFGPFGMMIPTHGEIPSCVIDDEHLMFGGRKLVVWNWRTDETVYEKKTPIRKIEKVFAIQHLLICADAFGSIAFEQF